MTPEHSRSDSMFGNAGAQIARLMFYSLMAIVLMAIDQKAQYIDRFRGALVQLVVPVYYLASAPGRLADEISQRSADRHALLDENQALTRKMAELQSRILTLESVRAENRRIRALLGSTSVLREDYIYAELLSVDLDPWSHRVMIDRGLVDGIEEGMAVIDATGVVGQVEGVASGTSQVRLISDPDHALPVEVTRSGLRAIAWGSGDPGVLVLPSVAINADIQPGDRLVTSGLGQRFPGGYPAATVVSVQRDPGQTFARVFARPAAALDRGREVLLLKPAPLPTPVAPADPAALDPASAEQAAEDPATDVPATAAEEG